MGTDLAIDLASLLFVQIVLIGIGYLIERTRPVVPSQAPQIVLNIAYTAPLDAAVLLTRSIFGPGTALAINALGGGVIALPVAGPGLVMSVLIYTVAMDGAEYAFHRAQHRFPVLWALHSLHHSDPGVNVSTTPRHFWGDQLLKDLTIYSLMALVFKANAAVIAAYSVISVYNYVLHMNIRLGFGRWCRWLNSPQYHRLHHSALPMHHDRNFAQFLPIFDLLGGTFKQPEKDEFPPTGLDTGETPYKLHGMVLWPWRRLLHLNQSWEGIDPASLTNRHE